MKQELLFALAVLAVLSVAFFLSDDSDAADSTGLPQELYPDADVIISESSRGVLITFKNPKTTSGYSTRTVAAGSSLKLTDLSDIDTDYSVVMIGGRLGDLTLINIDGYEPDIGKVDISFVQISGSLSRLFVASVQSDAKGDIPNSYSDPWVPIGDVSVSISGSVTELIPFSDRLGVSSVLIEVKDGADIDRLFPSGKDAVIDRLSVTMTGGAVGYMSNQCSIVKVLEYDLVTGTVDYLCLGADVEGGPGYYLTNLWTFYVLSSADISVMDTFRTGSVILGAGLTDIPGILCNGEAPVVPVTRSIEIDAPGLSLVADRSFSAGNGEVYRFANYTIGTSPSHSNIRVQYTWDSRAFGIYGAEGVWSDAFGSDILSGTYAYLVASVKVPENSTLHVCVGGILFNPSIIEVFGAVVNDGLIRNGGLIEECRHGSFSGNDPDGDGHVAERIESSSSSTDVNVMTVSRNAVSLRGYDGEITLHSAMVIIESIKVTLTISLPNDVFISGDPIVISVYQEDPDEGWSSAWRIYVSSLETTSAYLITLHLTVPVVSADGYTPQFIGPRGYLCNVTDETEMSTTFTAGENGIYQFRVVSSNTSSDDIGLSPLMVNALVVAVIVVMAAAVVLMLLRRN